MAVPLPSSTPTSSDAGYLAREHMFPQVLIVSEFEQLPSKLSVITIGVSQGGVACHLSQRSTVMSQVEDLKWPVPAHHY